MVASPASALRLGMTASDVGRIMDQASTSTRYFAGRTEKQRLDFLTAPLPAQVSLANGRVSAVALAVFSVDKGDLHAFSRRAATGMSGAGVQRALGAPKCHRRLERFGVELDQIVFQRADGPEVSVFLVDDRVIARTLGRGVPPNI